MKILTLIALAVVAVYICFAIALNSAAKVGLKLWGVPVSQSQIQFSNGATYPYQLQPAKTPQQPKSVVLEAAPSNTLQP